jgi:hypothetical protein
MVPLPDAATIPGIVSVLVDASPAGLAVLVAAVAGAVWLARGAAEELRRAAARDWEARIRTRRPQTADRFAA